MADLTEIKDLPGAVGVITNNWVVAGKRNGLDVRRKFKGLSTCVDIDDNIQECIIYYFEQELYPNHTAQVPSIAKTLHKAYHLKNIGKRIKFDITPTETIETEVRDVINTLNSYVSELGQDGIVDPVNGVLADINKLPLDVPDFYVLNSK